MNEGCDTHDRQKKKEQCREAPPKIVSHCCVASQHVLLSRCRLASHTSRIELLHTHTHSTCMYIYKKKLLFFFAAALRCSKNKDPRYRKKKKRERACRVVLHIHDDISLFTDNKQQQQQQ